MKTTTDAPVSATGRRTPLRAALSVLRLVAGNLIVFIVLAEIGSLVIVHLRSWPSSRPTYHLNYNLFWADINPVFGMWHRSNGHFFHQGGCFSVEYTTNSYGARDAERSLHSSQPRTVVLGDSFVEGFGLPSEDRLSNVLERRTGREYLNFGTSGDFGPLEYALLYRSMAALFDHKLVLVGVFPFNDFCDMDLPCGKVYQTQRYRPYYTDDFSIIYTGHFQANAGEGLWNHIEAVLRAYLASYHVGQYIHSRSYWRRLPAVYSGYNDYKAIDLARLQRALQDIKSIADADGARVDVFLIPHAIDFQRLQQSGANRLGPVMERWGDSVGISVKDLLPEMEARSNGNYRAFFLPCDGHWSALGNTVAANILQPWLDGQERSGK